MANQLLYVIGHESYRIRKPIFLLMINTNLPPILHRFQVMVDY